MAARRSTTPSWLKALGRRDLPSEVHLPGGVYALEREFKHDFFAATGLYRRADDHRVVVKFGRRGPVLGLPGAFLGRWLVGREARIYQALADLPGVPKFAGCIAGAFAHEYVPGHPLGRREYQPPAFYDRLERLIHALHRRGMAYVDLEKCENIIVGDDGRPHLIDFQISWHVPGAAGRIPPLRWIRAWLQRMDDYHLLKHRGRQRAARGDAQTATVQPPVYIRIHRAIVRPLQRVRRGFLRRVDPEWRSGGSP